MSDVIDTADDETRHSVKSQAIISDLSPMKNRTEISTRSNLIL